MTIGTNILQSAIELIFMTVLFFVGVLGLAILANYGTGQDGNKSEGILDFMGKATLMTMLSMFFPDTVASWK